MGTDEWEYPTPTACKWTTDLKRGGVSIWNWVGDYHFINNANKFELWFSKPLRRLVPVTRDFVGQDELTVSAWHTPGKELKFETNLPEFRTMKITSAGPTKTFWF